MAEKHTLSFVVPGPPVGQPRARFRIAKRADGSLYPRGYNDGAHAVEAFKAAVRLSAASALAAVRGWPKDALYAVQLLFVLPRPKPSKQAPLPARRFYRKGKPDLDNLAKSTYDALSGTVWDDDSQVVSEANVKVYGDVAERPRTVVRVTVIGQ